MLKIKIQSFGDVITNSSSEIYTIYDLNGIEQIESAITTFGFGFDLWYLANSFTNSP